MKQRHMNRKPLPRKAREPQSVTAQLTAERALDKWFEQWRVES